MGLDAIPNARVGASNNKNTSKKKWGNKQKKSKQHKVHVKREQTFSQVNRKEYNEEKSDDVEVLPPSIPKGGEGNRIRDHQLTNVKTSEGLLPINLSDEALSGSIVRKSDFCGLSKDFYGSTNSSCSDSSSSSCIGEDGDAGCLDDWEAVADAFNAEKNRQPSGLKHNDLETQVSGVNGRYQLNSIGGRPNGGKCRYQGNGRAWGPNGVNGRYQGNSRAWNLNGVDCRYQGNSRAWSPNDEHRPRNLPSILKKQYKPSPRNSEKYFLSGPSSCPICCEDLDVTDSSFLPCPCDFQLCLFCHNKILEVDGRCPGCRKHYDSVKADADLAVQTTHSFSKNTWH